MINIAVIEKNAAYRQTLSIILQLDEKFRLIHKLPSCNDIMPRFTEQNPDVVLMDINLPCTSDLQAIWKLKQEWPDIKVLMLTMFEEEDKIFGALKAGAHGYLLKKDSNRKIIDSIHAVHKEEFEMNSMIASQVLDYFYTKNSTKASLNKNNLSESEKEVLQLLIKGLSYKEIAAQRFITPQTLHNHIKNIYQKLNVHSRAELAENMEATKSRLN